MTGPAERQLTGRNVLHLVVGFFAVVGTANAAMIWLAQDTFPGLVNPNAYRDGLAYNQVLAAHAAQAALGWRVDVDLDGEGPDRTVMAKFRDSLGSPIAGLDVTATLIRPVVEGRDVRVALAERIPGIYRGAVTVAVPGNWRLAVVARRPAAPQAEWRMERELWLK
jgi:nitrogen fixation protein FixH